MKFIKKKSNQIGGKAKNLFALQEIGFRVPKFIVIPADVLTPIIADKVNVIATIDSFEIPSELLKSVLSEFSEETLFAVRSSAIDEDGSDFSFAGQFESLLFVNKNTLEKAIKTVWKSAFSERVVAYRKKNNLTQTMSIAIIIQEMIDADVAGVGFGMNPTNGDRNAKVLSAVYGLGEGLVSGELDADTFIFKNNQPIEQKIAHKTHQLIFNKKEKNGLIKVNLEAKKADLPTLNTDNINELVIILDTCQRHFYQPQDIEFAIKNGFVYLLQARPITNLNRVADINDVYTLWDNSNIIESYPGVTTPLTFSFISESYEGAYKLFSEFMGVSPKAIQANERIYKNTLGLMNGRVYYNLKTWYQMLALLPGYSINARFMEKMMGVKERFDIPDSYRLSKGAAWWSIFKMAIKMFRRYQSLPRKRKEFMTLLNETIAEYKAIDLPTKSANELMQLYLNFEKKLLNEWKAPLLNDFFAMIWFGLLEKRCQQYKISDNSNIHNDLLCGSSDIISTQPIHRSIDLATIITDNDELKALFLKENENTIWKILEDKSKQGSNHFKGLKLEIDRYIHDFGERCIGELKLETISYTQEPTQFVRVLKSYVETGITQKSTSNNIENQLRSNAEKALNNALKAKPIKKWRLKNTLKKARDLVSSRENLRYERTRAFGIVRAIFSNMGIRFYAENIIEHPRDIFYLTKEEIFSFIEGRAVTQDIKALIGLRKAEFEAYKKQETPSERFLTYGAVYHANDFFSTQKLEAIEGDLKGIGCCPGRVRAKVRVVTDPKSVRSLDGDILVTSSTDPGWVTLFPSAGGIIVERGSLLSHSAIVSREMGIPCIVSVTGLLKTLKTGDIVEMDGSTGEISRSV
ncbi:MAG: PEP/pyruvate-binding domain-containing protein [Saprospiraceae bacterium]